MTDDVAPQDKPLVYEEEWNGTTRAVYRASGLDSCPNALLAARMRLDAAPPPPWLQKRFNAGHDHEPLILKHLSTNYGIETYGYQAEVELACGTKAIIRGHTDAQAQLTSADQADRLYIGTEEWNRNLGIEWPVLAVVDAKALAPAGYENWVSRKFDAFPYYLVQQAVYCYALDFGGVVMAVKNKATDDHTVDFFSTAWIMERVPKMNLIKIVLDVEKEYAKGPQALFERPCTNFFPCPYFKDHPPDHKQSGRPDAIEATEPEVALVREVANRRANAMARLSEAQREKDECEAELSEFFRHQKGRQDFADGARINGYFQGGSAVDWDRLYNDLCPDHSIEFTEFKKQYTRKTEGKKLTFRFTQPANKE